MRFEEYLELNEMPKTIVLDSGVGLPLRVIKKMKKKYKTFKDFSKNLDIAIKKLGASSGLTDRDIRLLEPTYGEA